MLRLRAAIAALLAIRSSAATDHAHAQLLAQCWLDGYEAGVTAARREVIGALGG